jgi:hypothetical protein
MSYDNLSSVSQNVLKFYQQLTGEERRIPFIFDDFHFCRSRVIGLDMTENRIFTLCRMIIWVVFLRMFWNFISSLPVKRGGSLSFLVGTISNVLVMEIGWTDVGSGGYILVSCAHSNTSLFFVSDLIDFLVNQIVGMIFKTNSDKSFYVRKDVSQYWKYLGIVFGICHNIFFLLTGTCLLKHKYLYNICFVLIFSTYVFRVHTAVRCNICDFHGKAVPGGIHCICFCFYRKKTVLNVGIISKLTMFKLVQVVY